jgi:uncharacterized membrane protein (Fun14 family)
MEGVMIFGLIALVVGYWILALFLLIKGLFQINKDKSKGLTKLIIGVIMLVIGGGFCSMVYSS